MKIPHTGLEVIDWDEVPAVRYPGETASADWRSREVPGLRVRRVDYAAGYLADHWCNRGHVIHVLTGTLTVELRDGREFHLKPGMSWIVADHGDAAHRTRTRDGAEVFIVD
ncbi:DHCW motif cupin fold protein [Govanella unica]|uniref:DHCW motif cupin fold protein n=1 Tax=Govanella unica TaxID=2975056 RepID=A0A9X3TYC4_9PROT|nr:DHCW motif cupin fold protein [Govania unica]